MRAVVLYEYGGPEKLKFEDNVSEPQISGDTVLIAARPIFSMSAIVSDAWLGRSNLSLRSQWSKSVKLVKNGTLKTHPGFPHGMPTTNADQINADLLTFFKGTPAVAA
jgi:hypothetical protein